MVHIIGYTYEADCHCVCCTIYRFGDPKRNTDENGVPFLAVDGGGNFVHPIFNTDEQLQDVNCGTCGDSIYVTQGAALGSKNI